MNIHIKTGMGEPVWEPQLYTDWGLNTFGHHNNRNKPVQIRCSRTGNFLLALCDVKEHGLVGLRPLEVKALFHTIPCRKRKQMRLKSTYEESFLFNPWCVQKNKLNYTLNTKLKSQKWIIHITYLIAKKVEPWASRMFSSYQQWLHSAESPRKRCWRGKRWGLGACGTGLADGLVGSPEQPGARTETGIDLLWLPFYTSPQGPAGSDRPPVSATENKNE